jgi:NAD(P)-dependent dehydrogenase (short-subunit alcohol dehydrogenase family)
MSSAAVLVTGAAGGIGRATVQALTGRGFRVYAGVRHDVGRADCSVAFGRDVTVLPLDVTDPEAIRAAAKEIAARQRGDGLRAVVNNAGVIVQGPLELVPPAEIHRQFAINVFGPVGVTAAMLPLLRAGKGRVVNISAPTARIPVAFAGPIGASKAALESFSYASRLELAPWGIHVVIVVPGSVDTQIFSKANAAAEQALATAEPDQVALYTRQLEAVGAALAGRKSAPPQTVAKTIVRAIEARRPKARYVANSDAKAFDLVARLPLRVRERMLVRTLGLNAVAAGK